MDLEQPTIFLVEALLQPFAEAVATSGEWAPVAPSGGAIRCPACTGLPVVGVLREKGHGAQRSFVCGLCFTEWPTLRLMCPACGEERFDRLPVFRAGGVGAARVDACDACRAYVKTIDLTEDGEAVPLVDDLASVPLDLWARGEGYARIRPNLLRL
jgi:FdhE protein